MKGETMTEESNQGPSGGAAWLVIAVIIVLGLGFAGAGVGVVASLLGG